MAALHEFREAMEDLHSSIRNKGGYMMGVLRKYLPGEAASGVTYDGQKISDLEKSMLDTDTFADPWKQLAETDERAKAAGVSSKLEVWDEMIHVWHRYFPMLREAREANSRIGEFVRDIMSSHAAAAE